MNALDELRALRAKDTQPALTRNDTETEFSKGLRGGWATLGAQGQAFAGSAAKAVGADEFAANRDAAAQANLDEAGAAEGAAQTPSWSGVKDLRTFGNWLGYNAGQVTPALAGGVGAGVAGGLAAGPVGAIAAPTALFTPMEAGDIALRNKTDPEARLRGPQENFMRELGGGAASSLAGNVIPGMVGGKLVGTGAKAAAGRTFKDNVIRSATENVGGEAVGGGAGEAIKQVASNEGKPLDWDAVGANAAAGAVVGGALTPIGVAGDALHAAPVRAGTTMAGMAKSGLEAVKTKAQEYDPVNRIRDALTPKGDADLAKLAEGKPLDVTNEMAGADGQTINDRTAMEKVSSKLSEMLQDVGLTPELRASAEQTLANMANSPAAVRMGAVLSNSWAKTKDRATNLSTFAKDSLESWKGTDAAPADGVKHSNDYSGIRKTLTDTVVPWLQKNSPETLRSEADMADIGELFRRTMDHTYKSDAPLPLAVKYGLFQHFGGDTLKIMQSMQGAFKSADSDALTRHYEQLNQLRADQKEYTNLTNLIDKATQENFLEVDPAALTAKVLEWASRDPGKRDANDKLAEAKRTFENQSVQDELQRALGKHYESVMKAVEKEVTRQQDAQGQKPNLTQKDSDADTRAEPGSEDGAFDAPDGPDEQIVMGGKKRGAKGDGEAVMQSEVFRSRGEQGLDRAAQLLADAKIKYPDYDVSFRSEKDLGRGERTDHGYVVAERIRGADTFTPAEYESLRFDAKNHGGKERKNPARLDADGQIFDATKIERVGAAHMKRNGTPRDDDAGVARNQALMHGIAQLMIEHPALQVPDTAVVRYVDGKPVTLGEIKGSQLVGKPKGRTKDDLDEMAALADGDTLRKVQERRKAAEATLKAAVIDKLTRDGVPAGERREAYNELMSDPAMRAQHGVDKAALKEAAIKQIEKEGIKDIDAKRARFKEIVNDSAIRESFGLDQANTDADAIGKVEYGRQKASDMTTDVLEKSGRTQVSKDGNIHELTATQGDGKNGELRVTTNMDGSPRYATTRRLGGKPDEVAQRSIEAVEDRAYELLAGKGAAKTLGETMKALVPHMDSMTGIQRAAIASATRPGMDNGEISSLLQPLKERFLKEAATAKIPESPAVITLPKKLAEFREYITNPPADYTTSRATDIAVWAGKQEQRLADAMKKVDELTQTDEYDRLNAMKLDAKALKEQALKVTKADAALEERMGPQGSTPSPKAVAAKKAAFLEKVSSGDEVALQALKASTDPKSLQRAVEAMNKAGAPAEAIDVANARIAELLRSDETAAYGMQLEHKYSMERTAGSSRGSEAADYAADYLERVVPWVKAELDAAIPHAGEFDASGARDVIRVSVNAFNPESTAYHESMHAFIKDVMAKGDPGVVKVLQDAADSPTVLAQMKQFFKDEIGVLRQLKNDPEERIAVMYQMWANGDLNLGPAAKGVFQRIADFFKKVIGNWTNEQHAEHIMEYFSSGEYAGDRLTPNAVARATMGKGAEQVYARIRAVTKPLANLSEEVFGSGGANMRDMNVPAMTRIAELMKKRYIDEGGDPGYIPASRMAHTKFANQLAKATRDADEATLHEAVEALQRGEVPTSPEAKRVHGAVRKLTDDLFDYLHGAGVNLKDLGYKQDYFPRVWDPVYLSKNKEAFMDMARNYPDWHDPESTYNSLINSGGAELKVTGQPGMTASKERTLAFISHADAAPFMEKGLMRIMDSYILQATRKGEWARRFGEANQHMEELLEQAKAEGATQAQVKEAKKFVAGVNGTLGDDLNPTMRRLMGDMIVYQNVRLLPLAIFSSIPDSMGLLVRGGTLGDVWNTFKRGVTEIPKGLKGEQISDFQTHMAEDLEVITNASLTHALGTSYTQGLVGDTARKINDTFFKYNLMEQYTQSMRVGATEAALKFLQRHDAGLNVHSSRYMAELGLKKGDIQVVDGRVATRVEEGLTEAQAARVKAAVNQWVDGAILRPDAADKATWMNDPRYILIAHLKQFVYSFQQTIIGRVVHEAQNGNYTPAIALASYVPIMIGADAIKGMLQTGGGVPEWKKNWGVSDYLMNGVERAGLLGVGQIPADALTGNLGSLTGPTLEQFGDAVSVLGGRETFKHFALHSLPANALFSNTLGAGKPDPVFVE